MVIDPWLSGAFRRETLVGASLEFLPETGADSDESLQWFSIPAHGWYGEPIDYSCFNWLFIESRVNVPYRRATIPPVRSGRRSPAHDNSRTRHSIFNSKSACFAGNANPRHRRLPIT